MVLFDLLLFQFLGSQFLGIVSWMSKLVVFQFILSSAKFLLWISMDCWTFGYVLSSFGFKVEIGVGINESFAPLWILGAQLGFGTLVWSVMDLMVLLFFFGCFWRLFSEKLQCWMFSFDLLQYQHQAAYFSFCVMKAQVCCNSIHYFSAKFDWGFQWTTQYLFCCSVILWIQGWGCWWGWWKFCSSLALRDTLQEIVGLAGIGMNLMMLFFFCNFSWGLGMSAISSEGWVCWKTWNDCCVAT